MTASSNRAPARRRLLLASDRGDQSSELAGILDGVGDVGTVTTHDIPEAPAGKFSGIVDVDDLCFGDPRYAAALTLAVLQVYGGPVRYVDYWLDAAHQRDDDLFRLYVALFLLDLMGEHGQVFNGNQRPSQPQARTGLLAAFEASLQRIDQALS